MFEALFRRKPQSRPKDTPSAPEFRSRFGGLWLDRVDAMSLLAAKARSDSRVDRFRSQLESFILRGYAVIEGCVPKEAIDRYLAALAEARRQRTPALLASVPASGPQDKTVVPLAEADPGAPLTKVLDTYFWLPSALELVFAPELAAFIETLLDERPLAFQGLHFERGSTQAIHQDTAYVVLDEPMKLCASWIALEDIESGSGELVYYQGSHRLPDWRYSGRFKHFNHERDDHAEHLAHLQALHDRSKELGLRLESFLPKKGDVLVWAADLAHGGAPITKPDLSRRSLVTHYTTASNTPHYFHYLPTERRSRRKWRDGQEYCSFYY